MLDHREGGDFDGGGEPQRRRARRQRRRRSYVSLVQGRLGPPLAAGLAGALTDDDLAFVVNTTDDIEHLGLHVSPDIDAVLYTLAGLADAEQGGSQLRHDTFTFSRQLTSLGMPDWLRIGDGALAGLVERTRRLRAGDTLAATTAGMRARLGVLPQVMPVSNDWVCAVLETSDGWMPKLEYLACRTDGTRLCAVYVEGAGSATPDPEVLMALSASDLAGIVITVPDPWLGLDPMLEVGGLTHALRQASAPVVACWQPTAPGQAARIAADLDLAMGVRGIVEHYDGLIDGLVIFGAPDPGDLPLPVLAVELGGPGGRSHAGSRTAAARRIVGFLDELAGQRRITTCSSGARP
ncbi:MAG: 2-phospho-L-lactate transferase CofD family protein [Hyphomicrobiaceae bacterium]